MKRILYLFILISLISCNKIKSLISNNTIIDPDSPEVIFEKYKSSVVLIATQYYYEINVNGNVFYYSPSSERKIFSNKEDVLQNLSFATGTGFIISDNGEIITNNHVVNPKSENYKDEFSRYSDTGKSRILEIITSYNDTITYYDNNILPLQANMTSSEAEATDFQYDNYVNQKNYFIDFYETLDNININNSTIDLVVYKIGIAYNDTKVDDFDDLQECTIVKLSDDKKVDLALIQTNSGSFNVTPSKIFNFYDNNPNVTANPEEFIERDILKPVSINDDVFMIGYNRGFSLAITEQGIKSQFTSGKISQESDGVRILYTIPTLEGSSGSPVVDKWGNLIGVNFAKLTDSQSFGFAIPVYELKKFYGQ
jgi:S1-C subfamily serine protease